MRPKVAHFATAARGQTGGRVSDGSLVRVLEDWCPPFAGYRLYSSSGRKPSPAFSLVVAALRF